jgi:hypothetical protein
MHSKLPALRAAKRTIAICALSVRLIFCPNSGRIVGDMTPDEADCAPMPDQTELGELVAYLVRSSRLSPAEAARVVSEVLAFLDETVDDFIRRRHLALQAQGRSNSDIFTQIASELGQRRFRAPAYTQRQIRRVIYG